jgi:hypothetical protein
MPEENELHKEFIESLPEDLREHATPELVEHWDKYVQDKFTANAEANKGWEPYTEINIAAEGDDPQMVSVKDIPPEELAELLAFREVASNDDKFAKWYKDIGELRGVTETPPVVEDDGEYVDPELQELRQELADMRKWREEREAERAEQEQQDAAARSVEWVNGKIDEIKKTYTGDLTDDEVDYICALASRYPPTEDIVEKGFKDFLKIKGDTEKDFFEKKTKQPTTPETGGRSNTSTQAVTSYDDAGEAAKARIREAIRQGG